VPVDRDNEEERLARLEIMLEEYRVKSEALIEHAQTRNQQVKKFVRQVKANLAAKLPHSMRKKT